MALPTKFQLIAGHLALDFANTLDYRFDSKRRVDLLPDYEHLVEFARQSGIITLQQARRCLSIASRAECNLTWQRAVQLREAIDSLCRSAMLGRAPRRHCLQVFNDFLATAQTTEAMLWQRRGLVRGYTDLALHSDGPVRPIVGAAVNLLTSSERHYIRECSENSCRWLFLDRSKNHSRRWCDMRLCGNRSKVERFRSRQK
jgi:predicted RNA-binding Zn ribbon-like protein